MTGSTTTGSTTTGSTTTGTSRARYGRIGGILVTAALLLACGSVSAGAAAPAVPAAPPAAAPEPAVTFTGPPEPFARYVGQASCDPVEKPGATALRALLQGAYGYANAGGTARSCSSGGKSEHKEGRSYDWMRNVNVPVEKAMADAFVVWATGPDKSGVAGGNARRLGIMYLIWNKRQWSAYNGGTWQAYTGASPHTDHVHTSLSWDGAFQRTSWWTGRTLTDHDYGPCAVYSGEPAPRHTASSRNTSPCPTPVPRVAGVFAGDWDGDGDDELGTFRDGLFALAVSGTTRNFRFGSRGDVPVVGDWNADGRDEVGVFRRGTWYLREGLGSSSGSRSFGYGSASDIPVTGVWDAGFQGIGVRRGAQWFLRSGVSAGPTHVTLGFGRSTDRALTGDWDRNGVDEPGVRRGAQWYLARSIRDAANVTSLTFGSSVQVPATGDWDGDGTDTSLTTQLGNSYWRNDNRGGSATFTGKVPF